MNLTVGGRVPLEAWLGDRGVISYEKLGKKRTPGVMGKDLSGRTRTSKLLFSWKLLPRLFNFPNPILDSSQPSNHTQQTAHLGLRNVQSSHPDFCLYRIGLQERFQG